MNSNQYEFDLLLALWKYPRRSLNSEYLFTAHLCRSAAGQMHPLAMEPNSDFPVPLHEPRCGNGCDYRIFAHSYGKLLFL